MKMSVRWTCGQCGKKHVWRWDECDATIRGPVTMKCEKCKTKTSCIGDGNGNFIQGKPNENVDVSTRNPV